MGIGFFQMIPDGIKELGEHGGRNAAGVFLRVGDRQNVEEVVRQIDGSFRMLVFESPHVYTGQFQYF